MDPIEPTHVVPDRKVTLPRGRTLRVRPVTAADLDGLEALYAGLDIGDRYRRFFSAGFEPPRSFFERMTTAAERGGAQLVAGVVDADDHGETIVGECGYVRLPNGDGELAMAVAEPWRGWLGPYMLDALVETAAANGVPNLEADVLVTNRPMIALAAARGAAAMDHSDMTTIRLLIGTSDRVATWPGDHDKPRVLVEGVGAWHAESAARSAGLEVLMCAGPRNRTRMCPLLAGRPCPLAAGADAIVVVPPADGDGSPGDGTTLVDDHHRLHPGVPVCVELLHRSTADPEDVAIVPSGGDSVVVGFVQRLARERAEHASQSS